MAEGKIRGHITLFKNTEREYRVPCIQYATLEAAVEDLGEEDCLRAINRRIEVATRAKAERGDGKDEEK